jgi:dGTPase
MAEQKAEAEAFLFQNVYRHPKVMRHRNRVTAWIASIFEHYCRDVSLLPKRYEPILRSEGDHRAVADFIADQTDRSARMEALRTNRGDKPRSPMERLF